jgi:hypothetical protein
MQLDAAPRGVERRFRAVRGSRSRWCQVAASHRTALAFPGPCRPSARRLVGQRRSLRVPASPASDLRSRPGVAGAALAGDLAARRVRLGRRASDRRQQQGQGSRADCPESGLELLGDRRSSRPVPVVLQAGRVSELRRRLRGLGRHPVRFSPDQSAAALPLLLARLADRRPGEDRRERRAGRCIPLCRAPGARRVGGLDLGSYRSALRGVRSCRLLHVSAGPTNAGELVAPPAGADPLRAGSRHRSARAASALPGVRRGRSCSS